jgi:hypothetical protein
MCARCSDGGLGWLSWGSRGAGTRPGREPSGGDAEFWELQVAEQAGQQMRLWDEREGLALPPLPSERLPLPAALQTGWIAC